MTQKLVPLSGLHLPPSNLFNPNEIKLRKYFSCLLIAHIFLKCHSVQLSQCIETQICPCLVTPEKVFISLNVPDGYDAKVIQYAFSKMWDLKNSSSCILFNISHRRSVCQHHRSPAVNCAHSYTNVSELSERSYFCQIRM